MPTWYYTTDGANQFGPLDDAAIGDAIRKGLVQPENLVFKIGDTEWRQGKDFPELFSIAAPAPSAAAPDPFAADLSLSNSFASDDPLASGDSGLGDIAMGGSSGSDIEMSELAIDGAMQAAGSSQHADSQPPGWGSAESVEPDSRPAGIVAATEPSFATATQDAVPPAEKSGAPVHDAATTHDPLPWTVELVQAGNGNWGAEITFPDAESAELRAVRDTVKQYASIAFGGLPRLFASDKPNKFIFNVAPSANKPDPWLIEDGHLPIAELPDFRDSLIHMVKILHANQLGFWVFDPRLVWRLPEGIKIAPPFWLPVFVGRPGNFASAPPEWRNGPNTQPYADTYVIACACFYAATGNHFDPELSLLPGDVYPPAEFLDSLLAPALQERPTRRPEDLAAWRALWPDQVEADTRRRESQGSPDETVTLPSNAVSARTGGTSRHGVTKKVRRASTVVSSASTRGKTKGKQKTRKVDRGPKPDYAKEIVPLDKTSLSYLRTDPMFWAFLLMGVAPLLVLSLGDVAIQSSLLLVLVAIFWGTLFHGQGLIARLKSAAGGFLFSGLLGVFGLFAVYSFLPPFVLELPSGNDPLMSLPGSILVPGVAEEICKLIPVALYFAMARNGPSPLAAVGVGVGSGLGFAALKNATYHQLVVPVFGQVVTASAWNSPGISEGMFSSGDIGAGSLLAQYSLFFAQAAWTGIAAYFIVSGYIAKNKRMVLGLLAVALPALLHGAYSWLSESQAPAAALVVAVSFLLFYSYFTKLKILLAGGDGMPISEAVSPTTESGRYPQDEESEAAAFEE